ncbi:hypothetical protein [Zavarzinella formosa]|uniref:hypothetical protein n=1 Tax=Zavarzinella formosa TaxID=360055 RepID=UPI0003143642|nr:hypothetical protein [Zavarzinella formosa]
MTIYMPASPGFTACRFGLETNTQKWESPLTKNVQRVLLGGGRWMATYTLPRMNRSDAAYWQAFLMQLEGGVNTFYGFDPDARNPRGVATGTPLVKGASQTGSTLLIDGCTANVTGWLMPGDYFACNGQMHMITTRADTNGSGETTLNFKAAMRNSPADNAVVTVRDTTCTMILTDDNQTVWQTGTRLGIYEGMSFSGVEVF